MEAYTDVEYAGSSRKNWKSGLVTAPYVSLSNQLANVLTKGLSAARFQEITYKLEMENIHSPIEGKGWEELCSLIKHHPNILL